MNDRVLVTNLLSVQRCTSQLARFCHLPVTVFESPGQDFASLYSEVSKDVLST